MKHIIVCLVLFSFFFACKEKTNKNNIESSDETLTVKYSKYNTCLYSDVRLIQCSKKIKKADSLDIIDFKKQWVASLKAKSIIAKVRSGNKSLYILRKFLADKPIVFTEETPLRLKNDYGSKIIRKIDKGTFAFIVDEKGSWTKIYIGKINGEWITRHWVRGGFSQDSNLVKKALQLEIAEKIIKKILKKKKVSDTKKAKAKELIETLSSTSGIFQDKAKKLKEALKKHSSKDEQDADKQNKEQNKEENKEETDKKKTLVKDKDDTKPEGTE